MDDSSLKFEVNDYEKYHNAVLEALTTFADKPVRIKKFNIYLIKKDCIEDFVENYSSTDFNFSLDQHTFSQLSRDQHNVLRFYLDQDCATIDNITRIFLDYFEKNFQDFVFYKGMISSYTNKLTFEDNSLEISIEKKPDERETSAFLCNQFIELQKKYEDQ